MAYKVRLTSLAETDAYAAYKHILEIAPGNAEKWLRGLFAAIQTLEEMPARCPIVPEAREIGYPTRQLLYGKRTGVYRIFFDVQEQSEEGARVRILRIWHGSHNAVTAEDIDTED